MKIPNALQMKELDAFTIQENDIKSIDLMEQAAQQIARFICKEYPQKDKQIVIFSGPGNNGGDGLAVARLLYHNGYNNIQVFLFNTNNALSEDCKTNADRLSEECADIPFTEVQQQFEAPTLSKNALIIDALFGIGLNKPLGGGYAALVRFINATQSEVLSIDMPSGLMCEDNTYNSPSAIVRATCTLTLGLPKLALILADNQKYVGHTYVLDIGLRTEGLDNKNVPYQISSVNEIKALLKPRSVYGHKGTFGNALLIAGKYGMAGAAIMAAKACLKNGCGKSTHPHPNRQ